MAATLIGPTNSGDAGSAHRKKTYSRAQTEGEASRSPGSIVSQWS